MKIVVLDDYVENPGDLNWGELEKLDELTVYDRTSVTDESEIISRIGNTEVVIINKTPITKSVTDACPDIKHATILATGYNMMDYVHVRKKGIPLPNVPSYGTASMDRFVIATLLELCHHVAHHGQTVHEGKWEHRQDWCYWDYPLIELDGKTMNIIGFGRIGQQTGKIARTMGMNILVYDNYPNESGKEIAKYMDLDTLYAKLDVVAPHYPLLLETQGIINKDAIVKVKDGVIILNNSRGPLIVKQGLVGVPSSSKVSGTGLNVVSVESVRGDNPFLKVENCIVTPHISRAPKESRQRTMDHTVGSVKTYLAGAPIHVASW